MILNLVVFLLASYAMASIIIDQKIFEELRHWINTCSDHHVNWFTRKLCQLISCYFCTGFWCGVFITLFLIDPFSSMTGLFGITFLDPILGGLVAAEFSYRFHQLGSIFESWAHGKYGIDL